MECPCWRGFELVQRLSKARIRMRTGILNQRTIKFRVRTLVSFPGFWRKLPGFWTGVLGRDPATPSECFSSISGCSTTMQVNEEVAKTLCFSILQKIRRRKEILLQSLVT